MLIRSKREQYLAMLLKSMTAAAVVIQPMLKDKRFGAVFTEWNGWLYKQIGNILRITSGRGLTGGGRVDGIFRIHASELLTALMNGPLPDESFHFNPRTQSYFNTGSELFPASGSVHALMERVNYVYLAHYALDHGVNYFGDRVLAAGYFWDFYEALTEVYRNITMGEITGASVDRSEHRHPAIYGAASVPSDWAKLGEAFNDFLGQIFVERQQIVTDLKAETMLVVYMRYIRAQFMIEHDARGYGKRRSFDVLESKDQIDIGDFFERMVLVQPSVVFRWIRKQVETDTNNEMEAVDGLVKSWEKMEKSSTLFGAEPVSIKELEKQVKQLDQMGVIGELEKLSSRLQCYFPERHDLIIPVEKRIAHLMELADQLRASVKEQEKNEKKKQNKKTEKKQPDTSFAGLEATATKAEKVAADLAAAQPAVKFVEMHELPASAQTRVNKFLDKQESLYLVEYDRQFNDMVQSRPVTAFRRGQLIETVVSMFLKTEPTTLFLLNLEDRYKLKAGSFNFAAVLRDRLIQAIDQRNLKQVAESKAETAAGDKSMSVGPIVKAKIDKVMEEKREHAEQVADRDHMATILAKIGERDAEIRAEYDVYLPGNMIEREAAKAKVIAKFLPYFTQWATGYELENGLPAGHINLESCINRYLDVCLHTQKLGTTRQQNDQKKRDYKSPKVQTKTVKK